MKKIAELFKNRSIIIGLASSILIFLSIVFYCHGVLITSCYQKQIVKTDESGYYLLTSFIPFEDSKTRRKRNFFWRENFCNKKGIIIFSDSSLSHYSLTKDEMLIPCEKGKPKFELFYGESIAFTEYVGLKITNVVVDYSKKEVLIPDNAPYTNTISLKVKCE